jgi:hypothetical protein
MSAECLYHQKLETGASAVGHDFNVSKIVPLRVLGKIEID